MTVTELLETTPSIQFIVDAKGNKTAVQFDFATWQFILFLLNWVDPQAHISEIAQLLADEDISRDDLLESLSRLKQELYKETYGDEAAQEILPLLKNKTPLADRLREARAKIVAGGEPLLDWAGLEQEIAERRGERE